MSFLNQYQPSFGEENNNCLWNTQNDNGMCSNFKFLESLILPVISDEDFNDGFMDTTNYLDTRRDIFDTEEQTQNLDSIRRGALEVNEFRRNGFECDLDDLDAYQVQLRRQSVHDRISVKKENNPIVLEVMAFKEKKKALRRAKSKKNCVFCKNNGESTAVYTSHVLKDGDGKTTCPVLRKYTCPLCGKTGDEAHTIKYCPKNEAQEPAF